MLQTPFGDHLKRERELRGVSLEELTVATRIPPRYLDALEAEQWELLPGGVFNRGFIRAIAKFLRLGEDDMLAEYETASRPAREAAAPPPKEDMPPPRDLTSVFIFAGVCLAVILALALGIHLLRPRLANWRKSRAESAAAIETLATPARDVPDSSTSAAAEPVQTPAAAPAKTVDTETKQPNVKPPPPTLVPVTAPAMPPPSVAAAPGAAPAAPAQDVLELKVEVSKKTSVMVNGDGRVLLSRHLSPGETRTFNAHDHFDVGTRNPSAVRLELNGQTQPPLHASGGRWNVTLTKDSLKKSKGGPH